MRKTKTITITSTDRDNGKKFLITEMSSYQAERWAMRAITALLGSGIEVPEGIQNAGMAAIATVGLNALGSIDFDAAEPLLNEMFDCVQFDMSCLGGVGVRPLVEGDGADIEELKTRLILRKEVFELHVGFSIAAKIPTTGSQAASATPSASTT